jgi:hypothetical protein
MVLGPNPISHPRARPIDVGYPGGLLALSNDVFVGLSNDGFSEDGTYSSGVTITNGNASKQGESIESFLLSYAACGKWVLALGEPEKAPPDGSRFELWRISSEGAVGRVEEDVDPREITATTVGACLNGSFLSIVAIWEDGGERDSEPDPSRYELWRWNGVSGGPIEKTPIVGLDANDELEPIQGTVRTDGSALSFLTKWGGFVEIDTRTGGATARFEIEAPGAVSVGDVIGDELCLLDSDGSASPRITCYGLAGGAVRSSLKVSSLEFEVAAPKSGGRVSNPTVIAPSALLILPQANESD